MPDHIVNNKRQDLWEKLKKKQRPREALDRIVSRLNEKKGAGRDWFDRLGGGPFRSQGQWLLAALALVAVIWLLSGVYIVDEGNRGVVTRFGAYRDSTQPGPHWHLPAPIERVEIVNVEKQRFIEVGYRSGGRQQALGTIPGEALMLTKDENIVDVRIAVQYQIKDGKQYLFNVLAPDGTLKQVTESVERGVIGKSTMDFVLTEGRSQIVGEIKSEIQKIMDDYRAGIRVTSVNLQDVQPPEEVQGAFADAIKAREDKQRLINEAEAYANEVIPKARGTAARMANEAEAYSARVIARAEGESSRFRQLLTEYEKAPQVTRKRLYIESIESVLNETDTVMVAMKNNNNVLYMPLPGGQALPKRPANPDKIARPADAEALADADTRGYRIRRSGRGRP